MDHEKYQISIERDGRMVPVGSISGESYRTATFSYIEEYLDDRNAVPVSISLPLQRGKLFGGTDQAVLKDFFRKGSPEDP